MDDITTSHFEAKFQIAFLTAKAGAFQTLFEQIMGKAHPADFIPCRPWGNEGDRKNDGYLLSERTLFQVYAPNEMTAAKLIAKIEEDFVGALPHWKQYFDKWVFVHNAQDGLPPQVIEKLLELERRHSPLQLTHWSLEELRQRLRQIPLDGLQSLFGFAPTGQRTLPSSRLNRCEEQTRACWQPNHPLFLLDRSEQVLQIVETILSQCGRDNQTSIPIVALHGMGGIGKTVLATVVSSNPRICDEFKGGVYWIRIGLTPDLLSLQNRLCRALGGNKNFESLEESKEELRRLLSIRNCLCILDDVWETGHAKAFDVQSSRSCLLITSREAQVSDALGAILHPVPLLDEQQSIQLFAGWSDTPLSELVVETHHIVNKCNNLPLALAICGGMIRDGERGVDILEAFDEADLEFIESSRLDYEYQNVFRAIQVSLEVLSRTCSEGPLRYLELCVFPRDTAIPEAAIITLWKGASKLKRRELRRLLMTLERKALLTIERNNQGEMIALHGVLQDFVCAAYDQQNSSEVAEREKHRILLHKKLLGNYFNECSSGWPTGPDDGYFLQRLTWHMKEARLVAELLQLTVDYEWLVVQLHSTGVDQLLDDFNNCLAALRLEQTGLDSETDLKCLAEQQGWHAFVRSNAHVLRRADTEWTGDKILTQLALSAGSPFTDAAKEHLRLSEPYLHLLRIGGKPQGKLRQKSLSLEADDDWDSLIEFGGGKLLSCHYSGLMHVWDTSTGRCTATFSGHTSSVHARILTDARIASYSNGYRDEAELRLWNVESGECLAELSGHKSGVEVIGEVNPSLLVTRDWCSVLIWNLEDDSLLQRLSFDWHFDHRLLPPNRLLTRTRSQWVGGPSNLELWNLRTGERICQLSNEPKFVHAHDPLNLVEGRPLGSKFIVGLSHGGCSVSFWCSQTGKFMRHSIPGDSEIVEVKEINDEILAIRRKTGAIEVVSCEDTKILRYLELKDEIHAIMRATPERLLTQSGVGRKNITMWNIMDGSKVFTVSTNADTFHQPIFIADQKYFCLGERDQTKVWFTDSGALCWSGSGSFKLSLRDERILLHTKNDLLRVIDLKAGTVVDESHYRWRQNDRGTIQLADGGVIPQVGRRTLWIWHPTPENSWENRFETKRHASHLGHDGRLGGALVVGPNRVATWSHADNRVMIWSIEDGKCINSIRHSFDYVIGILRLSPNRFLTICQDQILCEAVLVDAETGLEVDRQSYIEGSVFSAFEVSHGKVVLLGEKHWVWEIHGELEKLSRDKLKRKYRDGLDDMSRDEVYFNEDQDSFDETGFDVTSDGVSLTIEQGRTQSESLLRWHSTTSGLTLHGTAEGGYVIASLEEGEVVFLAPYLGLERKKISNRT